MCGIAGIYHFHEQAVTFESHLKSAGISLSKRGPDFQSQFVDGHVGLVHARLSILDVSMAGAQPMTDFTGRYTIIFNGEIYNYQQLKIQYLSDKQIPFKSTSDTEVLLYLYQYLGEDFVKELNGFFAFAIYDNVAKTVFIARDRLGIKPLLFYHDDEKLIWASEMKAILAFPVKRELNVAALQAYLQLNYVPAPLTMLHRIGKMLPGTTMRVDPDGAMHTSQYYKIPKGYIENPYKGSYGDAKVELVKRLELSVQRRLISDVPLGAFLSGGIDSSAIVALATRHSPHINTFSIGFKDEPYYDETKYAELVATKFETNHTTFSLTNNDLYQHLFDILDYLDEPFADSSAIAVYILCKQTSKKATVALSGDGADEMFAGYNKHFAAYKAMQQNGVNQLMRVGKPLLALLPKSRGGRFSNLFRQLDRYATGVSMHPKERYWRWCSFIGEREAYQLLSTTTRRELLATEGVYLNTKEALLEPISDRQSVNDVLYADMQLVLQNDMLVKVDSMSMVNSLEVRVPFLDHEVVNFAFSLPDSFKIEKGFKKRILKDAFQDILPAELYSRPKHGFEVPLLKWFRGELRNLIEDDLLNDSFVEQQGIFDLHAVQLLKQRLFSRNPGDVHAQVWGMIVFQYWWKKYLG